MYSVIFGHWAWKLYIHASYGSHMCYTWIVIILRSFTSKPTPKPDSLLGFWRQNWQGKKICRLLQCLTSNLSSCKKISSLCEVATHTSVLVENHFKLTKYTIYTFKHFTSKKYELTLFLRRSISLFVASTSSARTSCSFSLWGWRTWFLAAQVKDCSSIADRRSL